MELIYARNLGWLTYGHSGPGLGTPGGAIEVGLIWNLTDPGAYEGPFMELAVGCSVTFSSSGVPYDAGHEEGSPQGIKFGIGAPPGGAILYEQYKQISGQRQPAFPCDHRTQKIMAGDHAKCGNRLDCILCFLSEIRIFVALKMKIQKNKY